MKLVYVIILIMAGLYFIPPLFTTGGMFNVQYMGWENGEYKLLDGLYFPKVFFLIFWMQPIIVGISLPILLPKMNSFAKFCLNLIGGWAAAELLYEIIDIFVETDVASTSSTQLFTQFAICFIVAISFKMINKTWKQNT